MTYAIQLFDNTHHIVGELMTASLSDILTYLNKGLIVIDKTTNQEFDKETVAQMIGVSDDAVVTV